MCTVCGEVTCANHRVRAGLLRDPYSNAKKTTNRIRNCETEVCLFTLFTVWELPRRPTCLTWCFMGVEKFFTLFNFLAVAHWMLSDGVVVSILFLHYNHSVEFYSPIWSSFALTLTVAILEKCVSLFISPYFEVSVLPFQLWILPCVCATCTVFLRYRYEFYPHNSVVPLY